jgi:hypothetical protein
MANYKQVYSISDAPAELGRGETAILSPQCVTVIKNAAIYDSERAWEMTCVVTGRKFSPIQVPAHFLEASVCDGKAYKKYMAEQKTSKKKTK